MNIDPAAPFGTSSFRSVKGQTACNLRRREQGELSSFSFLTQLLIRFDDPVAAMRNVPKPRTRNRPAPRVAPAQAQRLFELALLEDEKSPRRTSLRVRHKRLQDDYVYGEQDEEDSPPRATRTSARTRTRTSKFGTNLRNSPTDSRSSSSSLSPYTSATSPSSTISNESLSPPVVKSRNRRQSRFYYYEAVEPADCLSPQGTTPPGLATPERTPTPLPLSGGAQSPLVNIKEEEEVRAIKDEEARQRQYELKCFLHCRSPEF